ncbi:MAG: DUF4350 domain-containing protein [Acidobacteriota bacterium]
MKQAAPWLLAALGLVAIVWIIGPTERGTAGSVLGRGPGGWFAAGAYREARGLETEMRDGPLTEAPNHGTVLVLTFPWQRPPHSGEARAVAGHLRRGGTVLLGYSGGPASSSEIEILEALGLDRPRDLRGPPPLTPWTWWTHRKATWTLTPESPWDGPDLELRAPRRAPPAPAGADVLYRAPRAEGDGAPLVFSYGHQRGRVVALPAPLFANAHLGSADNGALLETLAADLEGPWAFDEYHHGLVRPELIERAGSHAFDLFAWHVGVIYVLALVALARRFGPAWGPPRRRQGTTGAFLASLGHLHHRMGHHPDAARRMLERARALDPQLTPPEDQDPEGVQSGDDLVRFARALASPSHTDRRAST